MPGDEPRRDLRPDKPATDGHASASEPLSNAALLCGGFLGFCGSLFVLVIAGLQSNEGRVVWLGALMIFVVSAAFLAAKRTRRAGAGVVIGLATGAIIGSGICAGGVSPGPVLG